MTIPLVSDWQQALHNELKSAYFKALIQEVNDSYQSAVVYPPRNLIFNAFQQSSFPDTKVVIVGQDPYHGPGQAHGLSFSVNNGVKIPPSLKNIFKELQSDIPGFEMPTSGNLENWAKQGVLLLNAILSVEAGLPGSHKNIGWEIFTDAVIKCLSDKKEHLVFMLWGNFAKSKSHLIDSQKHLILEGAHPSPLARGAFFGCKHFSLANAYLESHGHKIIDWKLNTAADQNLFS